MNHLDLFLGFLVITVIISFSSCERANPNLHEFVAVQNNTDHSMLFGYDVVDTTSNRKWKEVDNRRYSSIWLEPGRIIGALSFSEKGLFCICRAAFRHNYWEWELRDNRIVCIFSIDASGAKAAGEEFYKDINRLERVYFVSLDEIESSNWLFTYPYRTEKELNVTL